MKPRRTKSLLERFWAKVQKSDDGCWIWTASFGKAGYGAINSGRRPTRMLSASRVMWEIAYGPIPEGLSVLHRCDVPRCVRPDHLFLGTQRDNIRDAMAKGRHVPPPRLIGDENPSSKMYKAQEVS